MSKEKKILVDGREIPASVIGREASCAASWLQSKDIGKSDVVALLSWNDTLVFVVAQACALIGARLVPLNWHLTAPELRYILADSGARALFGHSHLIALAALESGDNLTVVSVPAAPELARQFKGFSEEREDVGNWTDWKEILSFSPYVGGSAANKSDNIFYTSGTTGKPKGVVKRPPTDDIGRAANLRSVRGFGLDQAEPGQLAIACCPLYHSAPFAHAMMSWNAGLDVVVMPRFDAREFLKIAAQSRAAYTHMVPTMFVRLLELPEKERNEFDPSHLVAVAHGAASCSIPVKRRMIEWWGPVIREYYAATETGIVTASTSEQWISRPGTVGQVVEGADIRVIGEDGAELRAGQNGRLIACTESSQYFQYHGRDESPFVDGWNGYAWLGDIGHVDTEKFVFMTDRSADIIISGGTNISPAEIELELAMIDGVADCGVFGVPVEDMGEAVVALVECAKGAKLEEVELVKALSLRLARYKLPRRIVFVDKMPREESGKLKKRLLKSEYAGVFT